jgi:5-methylcytosine-specific restriction endonuclease McrBC GTP-binding regulatory subunit McrB
MYLFEYRDKEIRLQYTESFKLPARLMFIGTMNTADRSIRAIDVALRRRFDVFECPPDSRILERYYRSTGRVNTVPDLYAGFEALNTALTDELDRHHTIGHTFFMAGEFNHDRLRHVWRHQIGPLIEEYFFDRPDLADDYVISRFWPAVGA